MLHLVPGLCEKPHQLRGVDVAAPRGRPVEEQAQYRHPDRLWGGEVWEGGQLALVRGGHWARCASERCQEGEVGLGGLTTRIDGQRGFEALPGRVHVSLKRGDGAEVVANQ